MPAVSRLGDQGQHIYPGSGEPGSISNVSAAGVITGDGKEIALEGDLYNCSVSHHNDVPNLLIPLPSQQNTSYFGGRKVITVGAKSTCGATIIQGYAAAITEPPAPPIQISAYSGTTPMDVPLVIPESDLISTALDLDLLSITLNSVQSPVNGTVSMTPPGFITFIPDLSYTGPASFTYTLSSSNGSVPTMTANITVTP